MASNGPRSTGGLAAAARLTLDGRPTGPLELRHMGRQRPRHSQLIEGRRAQLVHQPADVGHQLLVLLLEGHDQVGRTGRIVMEAIKDLVQLEGLNGQ